MGLGRAAYPGCEARRASAHDEHARGDERDPVCSRNEVSVARFAKGFPAANHSLRVSRSVGMGWHLGAAAPCALPRTREQADKEASPTAAIINSQSVKGAEKGGRGSTRRAMTRGRKSKERSDISWSTRWASR